MGEMSDEHRLGHYEPSLQWGLFNSETRLLPCGAGGFIATALVSRTYEGPGIMVIPESTGQVDCAAEMELFAEREERFSYYGLDGVGRFSTLREADCDSSGETEK
jgi:hypothetical protein